MAGSQLERSASSVGRDSMAAFQRTASSVKMDMGSEGSPILPRSTSTSEAKLKNSPTMSLKDTPLLSPNPAIRNRNIMIGLLSTLLILAVSWNSFAPENAPAFEAAAVGSGKWSHGGRARPYHEVVRNSLLGGQKFLVQDPTIDMKYHNGPLLTGTLKVHLILYGTWSAAQKAIVSDLIKSFNAPKAAKNYPTVAGWWAITKNYKDKKKIPVAQNVVLGKVLEDKKYSLKKNLKESDIELLVTNNLKNIDPKWIDPTALYVVLTSSDVAVQGFCSSQCGTHSYIRSTATQHKALPFVWVGNPAKTCPGYCAWPFAKAPAGAGPNVPPLKAPNNDVGVDGMCITIASMISGAATNTLGSGYYQGGTYGGLEAAGVCAGIYGEGAYPGYAGNLLKSKAGASYNVNGVSGRQYLIPFMFDLKSKKCALQSS